MEIGLVSCTKSKKNKASKPKELYIESQLFRKKRKYVEDQHDNWYILSAKHGLLDPDGEPIEPYDETLSGAKKARKEKWAEKVFKQMDEEGILEHELVFHCGKDYSEFLIQKFEKREIHYNKPTKGLGLGEKLKWYKERNSV